MTRRTNARLAGFTFLFCIAVGIGSMVVGGRIGGGPGIAGRLAAMTQHTTEARALIVLVVASALLPIALPLQLVGILRGSITQTVWLPMAAFEIPLAVWLLVKGVAAPAARQGASESWP